MAIIANDSPAIRISILNLADVINQMDLCSPPGRLFVAEPKNGPAQKTIQGKILDAIPALLYSWTFILHPYSRMAIMVDAGYRNGKSLFH